MSDGFYLMHRGWQDNPLFNDEPFSRRDAWVWLIENAAYAARRYAVNGKTITLERGQLCASLRYLAKAWQWDEKRVRRFLDRAQTEDMIRCGVAAGQTVITICNYDEYQIAERGTAADTAAGAPQERRDAAAKQNEGKERDGVGDAHTHTREEPSPPPPEPPASLHPAAAVIAAFDRIRVEALGREHARLYPAAKDMTTARQWLAAGGDLPLIEAVFRERFARAGPGNAPATLAYLDRPVMAAIAAAQQGTDNARQSPPDSRSAARQYGSGYTRDDLRRSILAGLSRELDPGGTGAGDDYVAAAANAPGCV